MARSFSGGTDQQQYVIPGSPIATGTIAFRLKSTQATANACALSYWNNSSRLGWGFLLNNTANKVTLQCYPATATPVANIASTTTVNDGNWHSVVGTYGRTVGNACTLYVDGAQENTTNASGTWTAAATDFPFQMGDNIDTFWASYIGSIAEIAHWNVTLSADEIASLGKGYSPRLIRPASLVFYSPLVRDTTERKSGLTPSITGGSVADHCPVIGGTI